MNKIAAQAARLREFGGEVNVELRKCAWPARPELMESTVVVIVSVVLLAVFVGVSDTVLLWLLKLAIG